MSPSGRSLPSILQPSHIIRVVPPSARSRRSITVLLLSESVLFDQQSGSPFNWVLRISMTEYEIADLLISHTETILAFFMAFVSLTSAALLAAYFGAGILPRILLRIVAGLYSLGAILLIGVVERIGAVSRGSQSQMDDSMSWHPAIAGPSWVMPFTTNFMVVAMFATYICTLWYLFRAKNYIFNEDA